jgi:di/tricarboxylate transporter
MGYTNGPRSGSSLDQPGSRKRRARGPSKAEVRRALWEREMRRLRLITWVLAVVLLALIARSLMLGLTVAAELSGPVVAALLLAAVLLTRQGRRIEAHISSSAKRNPR